MAHEIWAHVTHVVKTRKIMNRLQKENNLPNFPKPSRRFQRAGTPRSIFLRGFWNRNLDMSIACWQCSWYKEQMSSPPPTWLWLPVFLISSAWWTVQLQEFRQENINGISELGMFHSMWTSQIWSRENTKETRPKHGLSWKGGNLDK